MNKHTILAETFLELISSDTNSKGGVFTIKSKKTQKEYSYKINRVLFNSKMYSHIFVETGYMQFLYLGFYSNGNLILKGKINEMPTATTIAFILNCITNDKLEYINKWVEFYHLGKCLKCGKPLTDSDSIKAGLGPYCRSILK